MFIYIYKAGELWFDTPHTALSVEYAEPGKQYTWYSYVACLAMQIAAAHGGDELWAQGATVPSDPYSLD